MRMTGTGHGRVGAGLGNVEERHGRIGEGRGRVWVWHGMRWYGVEQGRVG